MMVIDREDTYSLLLLAGGHSRRMGRDKAELHYGHKTFADSLIHKAETVGIRKKYLSGHAAADSGVCCIPDIYRERGPLGGIHACMCAMDTPYCLVMPVDVPQIPCHVLEKLLGSHEELSARDRKYPLLLKHSGRVEPLIGIYPTEMAGTVETAIKEASVSVFHVLEQWGYRCLSVNLPDWQLDNINTPEAYQTLLTHQEGREG
ncbi:MAG: molybdenum cofactor guanylyltransferase [Eubacterium sp.]|nr:molybdenum cofactor guanylyltransferase [Eubacterium sp.]